MAATLDLSKYGDELRMLHADIILHNEQILSMLDTAPVTAELIAEIGEEVKDLEVLKDEHKKAVRAEIASISRLNRTPDDVQKEEKALLEEGMRVGKLANAVLSKYKVLANTFNRARNRESIIPPNREQTFNSSLNSSFSSGPKLPKISVPEFDGNVRNFVDFKNLFENLVHNNADLSNVQKLYYLKKSLVGEAAAFAKDFEVGDSAYPEVWASLLAQFENKRLIVFTLFSDLMDLKAIKSESEVRSLVNSADSIARGLKINGACIENAFSQFLAFFVASKFDSWTKREWENSITSNASFPSFEALKKFVETRSFRYNRCAMETAPDKSKKKTSETPTRATSQKKTFAVADNKCVLCSQSHSLVDCQDFLAKRNFERFLVAKKNALCLVCLKPGHQVSECKEAPCKVCKGAHHFVLHRDKKPSPDVSLTTLALRGDQKKAVLLPTAVVGVEVNTSSGRRTILVRALLDSGSEASLISEQLVRRNRIRLVRRDEVTKLSGITSDSVNIQFSAHIVVRSRSSGFSVSVDTDVVPAIPFAIRESAIESIIASNPDLEFAEYKLASPNVDLILGSEYYESFMRGKKRNINGVFIRNTCFGNVISGPYVMCGDKPNQFCGLASKSVDVLLQRFWAIEDIPKFDSASAEQVKCAAFVENTIRRNSEGRFVVRLPFKLKKESIGESRAHAISSLKRVEKKSEPELRKAYVAFMEEYERLGHMSKVEDEAPPSSCYYIPHRAVLRPESSTTRLRVVFNASAKSSTGVSLNDSLMAGATIQPELLDTIIRFRVHQVAFCADISKMYRQVLVDDEDTDMQRIVWRNHPKGRVLDYRLKTVTYGTVPASYLSTYCLSVLANELMETDPEASRAIRSDFYMDDLLTGAESAEKALLLRDKINRTLVGACFELRKYMSNSPLFLRSIEPELVEELKSMELCDDRAISVLGLVWNPTEDSFKVKLKARRLESNIVITKRLILSEIARIFDPLGVLSPIVIRAKILLQDLWIEQVDWDSDIPEYLKEKFLEYYKDLSFLEAFRIPRRYSDFDAVVSKQLIGFCDASAKAYCAAVYLRSVNIDGGIDCRLVCAKTRVAPLKTLTIPKLELQSAVLLSELAKRIADELSIDSSCIYLFSDSTVALCWIRGSPDRWNVFVSNRVLKIRQLSEIKQWSYVRTNENPADLGTRGIKVDTFVESELWKKGPSFLRRTSPFESMRMPEVDLRDLPEQRKSSSYCNVISNVDLDVVERISSLEKLVSVIAYVLRFARIRKRRAEDKIEGNSLILTVAERQAAFNVAVVIVQQRAFRKEFEALARSTSVHKRSSLAVLCPFVDAEGVLRVGGRLKKSSLPFERKHPIILPAKAYFSEILVRKIHLEYYHANRAFICSFLIRKFWFVGGLSNLAKKVVRRCTVCIRYKAQTMEQLMGQLPESRVTISRPFNTTGVDFAGPFSCKCVAHRSTKFYKIYLALFVCFSTKAVHLEIVSDLSSEAFINCLARFVSRRGVPHTIYSDNATNFVGASNRLILNSESIEKYASSRALRWRFIPPRAPHHGGLWEAAIRAAKHHLMKATTGQVLNFEEYFTLFTRIEAILNSRPLCSRITNQSVEPLTPAHFLLGDSLVAEGTIEVAENIPLSRRYELVRSQLNGFWNTWSKDYINQLQVRNKWAAIRDNVRPGDIVLIKDDLLPSKAWKIGRVVQTFPDQEGNCRVVEVLFNGEVKRRAVTSLVPLLPEEPQGSSAGEIVSAPFTR